MSELQLPYSIIEYTDSLLEQLRQISGQAFFPWDGAGLLCERAKMMGFQSKPLRSANGSCHLWQTADQQWIALNLSRPPDWELLPALFQTPEPIRELNQVNARVKQQKIANELVDRGRLLGLAIASVPMTSVPMASTTATPEKNLLTPVHMVVQGLTRKTMRSHFQVLDLSSLWAGPLCSHLLQQCGATVTNVESAQRANHRVINSPKGAREFYQYLHTGKDHITLDFKSPHDLHRLNSLIDQADIVIEGSRPRALRHLGIQPEKIIQKQAGKIWISITGYGRQEPEAQWIAYGDDAAISGGLVQWLDNQPAFIGDAIADPLTGLQAALSAYAFWQKGESVLLDINLHGVAKHCAQRTLKHPPCY